MGLHFHSRLVEPRSGGRRLSANKTMPEQKRLTPEMLVPRMGEYLVQKGLINDAQLQNALNHQQEEMARGNTVLLGQALIDLRYLERSELDQAVTEQILHLRSALQVANRTLERT